MVITGTVHVPYYSNHLNHRHAVYMVAYRGRTLEEVYEDVCKQIDNKQERYTEREDEIGEQILAYCDTAECYADTLFELGQQLDDGNFGAAVKSYGTAVGQEEILTDRLTVIRHAAEDDTVEDDLYHIIDAAETLETKAISQAAVVQHEPAHQDGSARVVREILEQGYL